VAELQRLVDLGILVGDGAFRASDVERVRLVHACERAGLPLDGIAAAIRAGRLSLAFVEAAPHRRWAARSALTADEPVCAPAAIRTLTAVVAVCGQPPSRPHLVVTPDLIAVVYARLRASQTSLTPSPGLLR
jgi:hypothetical protein